MVFNVTFPGDLIDFMGSTATHVEKHTQGTMKGSGEFVCCNLLLHIRPAEGRVFQKGQVRVSNDISHFKMTKERPGSSDNAGRKNNSALTNC